MEGLNVVNEAKKILDASTEKLRELDNLIDNPPRLSGPGFHPPGFKGNEWDQTRIDEYKKNLEKQKEAVRNETKDQVAKLAEKHPMDTQLKVFDMTVEWEQPHLKNGQEKEGGKPEPKDISASQEDFMKLRSQSQGQNKIDLQPGENEAGKQPEETDISNNLGSSFFEKFRFNSLDITGAPFAESKDNDMGLDNDPDPDDDLEP